MKTFSRSTTLTALLAVAAAALGIGAGQRLVGQPVAAPREQPTTPAVAADPWSALSYEGAYEVETYDGLRRTVRSATVSVLGTVTAVRPGDALVDSDGREAMRYRSVVVEVAVDDVLSGAVADGTAGVDVEFGPFAEEDLAEAGLSALVGQQSIYLLRLKGAAVRGEGITADPAQLERNAYRLVNSGGLLDDAGGVVDAPLADGHGFVTDLEDQPFGQTVTTVDAAG